MIFVLRHGKTNEQNYLDKELFKKSIPKIIKNIEEFTSIKNVKRVVTSLQERCYESALMLSEALGIEMLATDKLNRCDEGRRKSNIRLKEYSDRAKRSVLKHFREDKNYAIILITHSSVYKNLVEFLSNTKLEDQWLYFRALSCVPYNKKFNRFYLKTYNHV